MLSEFDRDATPGERRLRQNDRHAALGLIALAESRPRNAIAEFRLEGQGSYRVCALQDLAGACDLGGEADSAIAVYERYLAMPDPFRTGLDAVWRAHLPSIG
jgi:hypothetical protein